MANLVYTRASTDEQSTQRQTHLLTEAGLTPTAQKAGTDDGQRVQYFTDPATTSKIPALRRAGFQELARYARAGDVVVVSELYRLCRDLSDITDLAATDATTTMLVNVLISVGQFQRDLQNELTREGLAAAWTAGSTSGRRPRIAQLGALDQVRRAYRDGTSIAALARQHGVSRGAIRTAVADLLPDQPAAEAVPQPRTVKVEMPGKIARNLRDHDSLGEAERHALQQGRIIRRGQGFSLHVTAAPDVHQALHAAAAALSTNSASSTHRKAFQVYTIRLNTALASASPTQPAR